MEIFPYLKECLHKISEKVCLLALGLMKPPGLKSKNNDGNITYSFKKDKKISTNYVGSLFVDRCTHADLLDHFCTFKGNLNTDFLIGLSTDGPSVYEVQRISN